ncbi:hypothetical protein [Leptospira perolatii]|uniref:hypothetical protein n=1 Tax=Leptospira perolatii TaxID=2023191 RepID=UPI000F63FC61|nr:hypothetical protein [Leptospira perolatii]
MDAQKYLRRFDQMVSELKKTEEVNVFTYHLAPPELGIVEEMERYLGFSLDASIRNFFTDCGGIQLRWHHRENEYFQNDYLKDQDENALLESNPLPWEHSQACGTVHEGWWENEIGPGGDHGEDGKIMIGPLSLMTKKIDYSILCGEGPEAFEETETTLGNTGQSFKEAFFRTHLRFLDWFSSYYQMAFFTGNQNPNLEVVLGNDYCASFYEWYVTDFASYLEFLIYSRGLVHARPCFYSANSEEYSDGPVKTDVKFFQNLPTIDFRKRSSDLADLGQRISEGIFFPAALSEILPKK